METDERENLTNALAHLEAAPVASSIKEDFLQNPVLQKPRTWQAIRQEYETKFGKNHHCLKLVCDKCGNSCTCRCSTPKTTEHGVCPECIKEAKGGSHFLKRAATVSDSTLFDLDEWMDNNWGEEDGMLRDIVDKLMVEAGIKKKT